MNPEAMTPQMPVVGQDPALRGELRGGWRGGRGASDRGGRGGQTRGGRGGQAVRGMCRYGPHCRT